MSAHHMDTRSQLFTNTWVVAALALIMCILWGSAYPAIKAGYAMFAVSPDDTAGKLLFAGYRFFFAGLCLIAFALVNRKNVFGLSALELGRVSLYGLLMTTLQYVLFYIGLSHTTGVKGSILNGTTTLFSVLFASLVFKGEKFKPGVILGCAIGFVGVIIVNTGQGGWDAHFSLTGEGFIILAAVVMSIAGIYGKIISGTIDPVVMTAWQLTIGGVVLLALGAVMGGSLHGLTLASGALYIYMILLSSAAFAIYSTLLKYNPVRVVTIFQFTVPLFGAGLSALFLGESVLEWKNLLALVSVSAGIYIVTRVK